MNALYFQVPWAYAYRNVIASKTLGQDADRNANVCWERESLHGNNTGVGVLAWRLPSTAGKERDQSSTTI